MKRGICKCGAERRPVAWVRRDLAHLVEGARSTLAKSEAAMKLHGEERKEKVFEALGAYDWQAEHTAGVLPVLIEELTGRCQSCARECVAALATHRQEPGSKGCVKCGARVEEIDAGMTCRPRAAEGGR